MVTQQEIQIPTHLQVISGKNKEKLQYYLAEGFQVRFYHADRQRFPIMPPHISRATVCLIRTKDGVFVRGISFCSDKDPFNKAVGRVKSFGRAVQALDTLSKHTVLFNKPFYELNLSAYAVRPTDWEKKLFNQEEKV